MQTLALMILFFAALCAGETQDDIPVFKPPVNLDWCGPLQVPPVQVVTDLDDSWPAAVAGFRKGDRLLQCGSLYPFDQAETAMVLHNQWAYLLSPVVMLRGQETVTLEVRGALAYGRMGYGYEQDEPIAWFDELIAKVRLEQEADRRVLKTLPLRIAAVAKAACDQGGEPPWWPALCADFIAAVCGRSAPPQVEMPTPYLQQVDALFRREIDNQTIKRDIKSNDRAFTEYDDPDTAAFVAYHFPYPLGPHQPAGVLTVGASDEERAIFQAMADERPIRNRAAVVKKIKQNRPKDMPNHVDYLNQIKALLIENKAGISRDENFDRDKMVAALRQMMSAPGSDRQTCAIALASLAAEDGDLSTVDALLRDHLADSPWLMHHAWNSVINFFCSIRNKRQELEDYLWKHPLPSGYKRELTSLLINRGLDLDPPLFNGVNEVRWMRNNVQSLWPLWWKLGYPYNPNEIREGSVMLNLLKQICRQLAEDGAAGDGAEALLVARQIMAVGRQNLKREEKTFIAMAFARAGDMKRAVSWQRVTALHPYYYMDFKRENEEIQQAEKRSRLYRAGKAWILEGSDTPLTPIDKSVGPQRIQGGLRQGKAAGLWTKTETSGKVSESCRYFNDEPSGRWQTWDESGRQRWDGWVIGDTRVGFWRIAREDGGEALGWYDGQEGGRKCGWWRLLNAQGQIEGEGYCLADKAQGAWRKPGPDGKMIWVKCEEFSKSLDQISAPPLPPPGGLGNLKDPANAF